MMQIINGKCVSRCVSLAADLAIANLLADGPADVTTIAGVTGTDPEALYPVLRMLSGVGIFVELPKQPIVGDTG
jgi:hypothetical protein